MDLNQPWCVAKMDLRKFLMEKNQILERCLGSSPRFAYIENKKKNFQFL